MVGETASANSFLVTPELYEDLDNSTSWYVAVVPYDDSIAKTVVEAVGIAPFGTEDSASTPDNDGGQLSLESLLTGPNLIAAGMLLVVVLLLVIVVRSRGSAQRRSKSWELQEATWGIQGAIGTPQPPHLHPHLHRRLHRHRAYHSSKPMTSMRLPTTFRQAPTDGRLTNQHNPCSSLRSIRVSWTAFLTPPRSPRCRRLTHRSWTISCEERPCPLMAHAVRSLRPC